MAMSKPAPAEVHATERRIFAEQVRELHNQRLTTVPSSVLTAAFIAMLMWQHASTAGIVQWLAAMLAAQGMTVGSVLRYRRAAPPDAAAGRWARLQGLNTALSGVAWGSLVLFVWPADTPHRLLLLLLLAGISAVAAVGTAALRRAVVGLLLPIWLLVLLRLTLESDPFYRALSGAAIVFLLVMVATAYRIHLILRDSIRLRCVNLDLIADLRVQTNRAQAADRAKTGFLAAASHDLRQPVHALGLLLRAIDTLVRAPHPDWQQIAQIVGQSRQALHGLSHLLAALLDISRLDAGVVELRPEPVPLQPLFDQLHAEFAADAQRRGLQLRLRPTSLVVNSDALALRRILGNLIANAVRYTSAGGVLVAARRRRGAVCIEVWDTGPGIPGAALETVFDEFVQLGNSARQRQQGLGLGLAIVRRLATSQGQRVEVRSRVGRGSVFRLTVPPPTSLPAQPQPGAAAPATPGLMHGAEPSPGAPVQSLSHYVLMLLDDDPDVLGATVALLATHGAEVATAGDLTGALDHADLPRVDALLVDYRLPGGVTGPQAVEQISLRLGRRLPAILITGDTAPERLREAAASGLPLLHKPLDPDALLRALHQRLQGVDAARRPATRQAS